MRICLRVSILREYPPRTGRPVEEFLRERHRVLQSVAQNLRPFEPIFNDSALVFYGLGPSDRARIETHCREREGEIRRHGMSFCFAPHPEYTPEEIENAKYVRLAVKYDEIDCDRDAVPYNTYPKRLCDVCWSYDLMQVPIPFVVRRPDRKSAIFNASNGIRIMSRSLWQQLESTLLPWVRFGQVSFVEARDKVIDDFVWITPTHLIGPYTRTIAVQRCGTCGRPAESRMGDPEDNILNVMDVVSEFPEIDVPIALVGMWFGELRPGSQPDVSWDIVISGELHAHLRKMKVRGFVAADRPIHTQDEVEKLLSPVE